MATAVADRAHRAEKYIFLIFRVCEYEGAQDKEIKKDSCAERNCLNRIIFAKELSLLACRGLEEGRGELGHHRAGG